jgi:hydroxyacylglutathione hydrolase
VQAGDVIKVGRTVELECLDTPGHTMCHICLCAHGDRPALFSGDTLFNAGAGNCHNGGSVDTLYTPSPSSSPSCPTTRVSIPATTTSRTT